MSERRRGCFRSILFLAASLFLTSAASAEASQIALSLRAAESQAARGDVPHDVRNLGGMTRLLGAVHDPERQDVILVGEVRPGEVPLSIDELAVMLRACVTSDCAPLVSIDPAPDSEKTGLQSVRYEGGIADTNVGRILLEADAVLKKLALGDEGSGDRMFPSYFDLIADERDSKRRVATRFWFFVPSSAVPAIWRQGAGDRAVALLDLPIGVRTQMELAGARLAEPNDRDEAAERFVTGLNSQAEMLLKKPEISRLQVMMGLAIIARKLANFRGNAALHHWTAVYRPAAVPTRRDFPLLSRHGRVRGDKGMDIALRIDGGVDLAQAFSGIEDGRAEWFGRFVLAARPSDGALLWPVPLGQWPGARASGPLTEKATAELRQRLGRTTIFSHTSPWRDGVPKISALPPLAASPLVVLPSPELSRKEAGGAKIRFDEVVVKRGSAAPAAPALEGRPAGETLSWPSRK